MCISRNHPVDILFGKTHQGLAQPVDFFYRFIHLVAQIKTDVQTNLVVATAGGVQLTGGRTYYFTQAAFDIHVNILQLIAELKTPLFTFP